MTLEEELKLLYEILNNNMKNYKKFYSYFFENGCLPKVIKAGGTKFEAEECFYEVLESLVIKKDKLSKITASLKGYFSNACYYCLLEKRRKQKERYTDDISNYDQQLADDPSQEEVKDFFKVEENLKNLSDCLRDISESCQKVIELFFFEKKKDKDIALILNYSPNFVRNKRRRCILQLKTCLEQKLNYGK